MASNWLRIIIAVKCFLTIETSKQSIHVQIRDHIGIKHTNTYNHIKLSTISSKFQYNNLTFLCHLEKKLFSYEGSKMYAIIKAMFSYLWRIKRSQVSMFLHISHSHHNWLAIFHRNQNPNGYIFLVLRTSFIHSSSCCLCA